MRAATLIVALAACSRPAPLTERLAGVGLAMPDAAAYSVETDAQELGGRLLTARSGDRVLRVTIVEHVDADTAARRTADRRAVLDRLFVPSLPPYPEFLTAKQGCPEHFHPRWQTQPHGPYALLYATRRLGFGVCDEDQAEQHAAVAFLYCPPTARWFAIEWFAPKEADSALLAHLAQATRCV